ncbi:uncharacterized protein LOC144142832 [Haemaphysalis longicornis]
MESRRSRPPARSCVSPDTTSSREKTDYWRRLMHSSREKARYWSVSNKMKTFIRLTPHRKGKAKTKTAKFREAFSYLVYLEQFIQAECAAQKIPLPPMCDRLTKGLREHPWEEEEGEEGVSPSTKKLDQKASVRRKARSKPAKQRTSCSARNATPRPSPPPQPLQDELSLTDDEAVVPDYTNLVPPRQGTREWELYGISQEDWMAAGSSQAGSSQQQTPPSPPPQQQQEESESGVTKTCVELTCVEEPTSGHPMVDAPACFVVTSSGDVVAVGDLPLPQLGGPTKLDG